MIVNIKKSIFFFDVKQFDVYRDDVELVISANFIILKLRLIDMLVIMVLHSGQQQ